MTDRWMSYAEAADALGMTAEGLRQRARREGWRRQLGNDGRARVLVSADTTPRPPAGDRVDEPSDHADDVAGERPDTDRIIATFEARIADLDARAVELRADVERERAERLRERDRADALANRVGDVARELAQVVGEAAARERELAQAATDAALREQELQARAAAAEATIAEYRARPWWRRLTA